MRFYDSNVLLHAFSKTADEFPKRDIARALLEGGDWCISAQVLQEFYANALRVRAGRLALMGAQEAAQIVERLQPKVATATDGPLVREATRISQRYVVSYWDAAIIAAAQRAGAGELLSEDLNAGQVFEGVTVVNPFA